MKTAKTLIGGLREDDSIAMSVLSGIEMSVIKQILWRTYA
jgi:hypothetical protein